jgi:phenylpyruvate tautomerase PptA (4-oxalocrotonate tautomerase family)
MISVSHVRLQHQGNGPGAQRGLCSAQSLTDRIQVFHERRNGKLPGCGLSFNPRGFVYVVFFTYAAGTSFNGDGESAAALLQGNIRAGRDLPTKQKMLKELTAMYQRIGGFPMEQVVVALVDVPGDQITVMGFIMPIPGEEKEWLKAHPL